MKITGCLIVLSLLCQGTAIVAKKKEIELPVRQHALHADYYRGLVVPVPNDLEESGSRHLFPGLSPDLVWRGALRVLMQQGIIVHVDSDVHMIVCVTPLPRVMGLATDTKPRTFLQAGVPHVTVVRPAEGGGAEILTGWIQDLYRRADQPERYAVSMIRANRITLTDEFILALRTEASSGSRWPYLEAGEQETTEGDR